MMTSAALPPDGDVEGWNRRQEEARKAREQAEVTAYDRSQYTPGAPWMRKGAKYQFDAGFLPLIEGESPSEYHTRLRGAVADWGQRGWYVLQMVFSPDGFYFLLGAGTPWQDERDWME